MIEARLETLRTQVESLHFAAMKIPGQHFLKVNRVLLETIRMDENGIIWASSRDALPKILNNPKGFNVQLRYVNKDEAQYLQIEGRAFIEVHINNSTRSPNGDNVVRANNNKTLIRVEVQRAEYFRKKILSRYTSFLQSIWSISVGRLIHSGHATVQSHTV